MNRNFTSWLQNERRAHSLSVGELAKRVGIATTSMVWLLKGSEIEYDLLCKLSDVFSSLYAQSWGLSPSECKILARVLAFEAMQKLMLDKLL